MKTIKVYLTVCAKSHMDVQLLLNINTENAIVPNFLGSRMHEHTEDKIDFLLEIDVLPSDLVKLKELKGLKIYQ